MILHLFNASHDEALAARSPYYYPTRAARVLERDIAPLPAWWATAADSILLDNESPHPAGQLGEGARLTVPGAADASFWRDVERIEPWGWDPLVRHRLHRLGAPDRLLPDDTTLHRLRHLSSRETSVRLLRHLRCKDDGLTGESRWCSSAEQVRQAVRDYGHAMLKAPWSSSGRGIFQADATSGASVWRRVERLLREQGAVEAEPCYDRLADFAMEFRADGQGGIRYEGLSLFLTTATGGYAGNLIASQETLTKRLAAHADAPNVLAQRLERLRHDLKEPLARLTDNTYRGPLGIDMMLVREATGSIVLHPCVEVNLRHTMGLVALQLPRLLPPDQEALFTLRPVTAKSTCHTPLLQLTPGAKDFEAILLPVPSTGKQA